MVTWAGNNDGGFPLPSEVDPNNRTIAHEGIESPDDLFKLDSTRAIYALLLFNGSTTTDLYVSPAEAGPIDEFDDLMTDSPTGAANPDEALWDPAFRVHPTNDRAYDPARETSDEGNFSYAHALPFGERRNAFWNNSFRAQDAVVGNRGASWRLDGDAESGGWALLDDSHEIANDYARPVGEASNTLLIHGSRVKWEGNIAYNDNHVDFETRPDPEDITFRFSGLSGGPRVLPDNLFVNEHDERRVPVSDRNPVELEGDRRFHRNNFLRSYSDRVEGSVKGSDWRVRLDIFYD